MKHENLRADRSSLSLIQTLKTVIVWVGFGSGLTEEGHEAHSITEEQDTPEGQVHKMHNEGLGTLCVSPRKIVFSCLSCKVRVLSACSSTSELKGKIYQSQHVDFA